MRYTILLSSLALLTIHPSSTLANPNTNPNANAEPQPQPIPQPDTDYTPFTDPLLGRSPYIPNGLPLPQILQKRQSCRSGYSNCSRLGANGACCPSGTNCALDQAGNVACCPINAYCTGTIQASISRTSTGTGTSSTGFVIGGATTTPSQPTAATTSFSLPSTGVSGGGSTIANALYPFIYIPTSYANAALCSTAYQNCQAQSTACFASLAGANGVTVSGYGGGITVQGATGTVVQSASAVCSSLSQQACYGLQLETCARFGGASGTFVQNGSTGNAAMPAKPRQTGGVVEKVVYVAVVAVAGVGGIL